MRDTRHLPATPPPPDNRGIQMPLRNRTREHDRNGHINAERALNAADFATRISFRNTARRADSNSARNAVRIAGLNVYLTPNACLISDPDAPPPF